MTDPLLSQFFNLVGMAFAVGHGENLVNTIPVTEDHSYFWLLHQAVSDLPESQIGPKAIKNSLPTLSGDVQWQVASLLSSVLVYVRDGPGEDEQTTYRAFKNILAVHTQLHKLYSQNGDEGYLYPFLNDLVLSVCRRVVELSNVAVSFATAPMREATSSRSIKDSARQALEKSMQVSSASQQGSEWSSTAGADHNVTDILWSLANLLWRVYASRRLHTQAAELSKTLTKMTPKEDVRLEARGAIISAGTLAESYYWRGRLGVVFLDFRGARYWFEKAWDMAPEDGWTQRRSILIRLIPAALLSGSLPAEGTLEHYDLVDVFEPLIQAFRDGDVARWRHLVAYHREWLRARNVWLMLFERGEILVWRNLFRHALKAHYAASPTAPKNRCPTWVFEEAAQQAFAGTGELEDGTLELEDTICVLSSLIDQSLLMGNISYSQRMVIMKPREDGMGGFPRLKDVTPRQVQANT